jgi:hypothetical protein
MNDRQRLEAIVSVVCKYLPPDGIPIKDAMSEIISIVDPLPPLPVQEPWMYRLWNDKDAQWQLTDDCSWPAEPIYTTPQEQEPVGYEHHEYRPFGAPGEIRIHAVLKSQYLLPDGLVAGDFQWLIDLYKADKNTIKLQPIYTTPPKRPWVGLTDEEIAYAYTLEKKFAMQYVDAKLKEKNT